MISAYLAKSETELYASTPRLAKSKTVGYTLLSLTLDMENFLSAKRIDNGQNNKLYLASM